MCCFKHRRCAETEIFLVTAWSSAIPIACASPFAQATFSAESFALSRAFVDWISATPAGLRLLSLLKIGMIFWEQNGRRNTEAEFEPYTRCLAINPNHVSAINNLGNVLKSVRKDYDGAERLYRKAIKLDPEHANACWNLSAVLEKKKDIAGAITFAEEYIRRGNPDSDGKKELARLRAKAKNK